MYIEENEYFAVKEEMADIIDSNFKIRKKSISNIARLYDDAMPCGCDEAECYIAEIHFYYMIWKKFGALSEESLHRIKRIAETVISLNPSSFPLNPKEYEDFIQLAKELYSSEISILTDKEP